MKKFGMSTEQRATVIGTILLQKAALVHHGKTLYDLASTIQRAGAINQPSPLESIVKQTMGNLQKIRDIVCIDAFEEMFSEIVGDFLRL